MDKPLILFAVLMSLSAVLLGLILVLRGRARKGPARRRGQRRDDGTFVLATGADGGSPRKGSLDGDGRDAGDSQGGDGGGDGGGGGGGD